MKLKEKPNSRKNVHMPIEPSKEQRSMIQNSGIDRVSSPDALLDENGDSLQNDQVIEDNLNQLVLDQQNEDDSQEKEQSIAEQNAQNSKNNIEKEEEQKQKLTKHYLHDYFEYILRPIGQSLILYTIIFVLVFVFIKAFWVFQDISFRKQSEEIYLKNLLNARMTVIERDFQHSFSFLDSIMNIFQSPMSAKVIQVKNQVSCDDFDLKYVCNLKNLYSEDLYKAIDSNYEMVILQLIMSMVHIDIKNVFFFTETEPGFLEFNLSKIKNLQTMPHLDYHEENNITLSYDEVDLMVNFIRTYKQNKKQDEMISYLDSISKGLGTYQMFQLYTYHLDEEKNNKTEEKYRYGMYCLDIPFLDISLDYYSSQKWGKVCMSIGSLGRLVNSSNTLYFRTDFPRIEIRNNTIISISDMGGYMQDFYSVFEQFVLTQIHPLFPEYQLDRQAIIQCLYFQDSFHQMFAKEYIQLQIFRCYPYNYMHMFVSKYVFAWSLHEVNKLSYHSAPLSLNKQQIFKFQSFIIPNRTFFQDVHSISAQGIENIENTLKFIGAIIIAVLFSFESSKSILKTKMIDSLFIIKKLSKLVISIDDAKKSENQFKKILKELQEKNNSPKTQIFCVLIGYLQKFLWIKKLYYYNKRYSQQKYKKTRLLFEGLNLFKYINDEAQTTVSQKKRNTQLSSKDRINHQGSSKDSKNKIEAFKHEDAHLSDETITMNYKKYPAVLIYIYQELIILELNKIQNFQNVKVLSKRRDSNGKSNQMHILNEIDNEHQSEPKYHHEKQEHDLSQQISIYGQDLPQISIMDQQPRQNRGVRFSNQIQLRGFNQDEKKSKFRQHILSNSSIGKKNSLKSIKSIEAQVKKKLDESERISKSEQDSAAASSSKRLKRQTTIKNILRGDESVHEDLKTMKFDQSLNIYEQKSNINKYSVIESSLQQNPLQLSIEQFHYTQKQILDETVKAYERITQHYEELIEIKEQNLDKMISNKIISPEEQEVKINEIYDIEIKRLKICFKYLKLLLDESKGDEIDFEERGINLNFDHLSFYESNYQIHQTLLDKSTLYKMKISICLGKTISYKQLQDICKSQDIEVSLEANYLYAEQLSKVEPFLDYEVINICNKIISNHETSITFKRKCLELMIKTLARQKEEFINEIDELQLIKRYYNTKHKKFYFIADLSEVYDIFTPILTKIYQLMGKMDLMQIYNLAMNQNLEDMELVRQIIKPQTCEAFLSLFEQLTLQAEKSKEKNSSKMIHKRMVCEKDFNQILGKYPFQIDQIQKDETQFSSFLVIILGGDQLSNHSSIMTDDVDSSNNQRQLNQLLYSEINRKIQNNYFHIIQIGTHLNNFMTKQGKLLINLGKLKKHIKNCSDLLEIDLTKKNLLQHFAQIQKYINY